MAKFTSGEAIVRSMEIEGITHVFGIIGGNILDVFDLVGRSDKMTFVGTRHEETASHMAHGFYRANGQMACCLVQNGAGLTNLATGLATAMKMHAPVLALTAGPNSQNIENESRHEIDQVGVMKPLCKWSARVPSADRLPEYMQRAFRVANTAPKGPVFLEVPTDVLKGEFEWTPPASKWEYRASYQAFPDPEAVEKALAMIGAAKRPVMVVGQGGEDRDAWESLRAISERLDLPLTATFGHNAGIPPDAALSLGSIGRRGSRAATNIVAEADLLVVVGSRLQRYTTMAYFKPFWPKDAKVIHVNSDPLTVGRFLRTDLGIAADAPKFLSALRKLADVAPATPRPEWRKKSLAEKAAWEEERKSKTLPATLKDGAYMNPAAVYDALGRILPEALFSGDVGSTTGWQFCMIPYANPKGMIYTGALAGLGFGMPGALGAKLACPDLPVVAVLGDGAFSLSISSLMTAVEHDIEVRILICDNKAWGAEKGHQMHWYDKNYIGADLKNGDLVEIATAMGADAVRCTTLEELEAALKVEPKGKPRVIIAPTDPDEFPEPVPHAGVPARSWMKYAKDGAGQH